MDDIEQEVDEDLKSVDGSLPCQPISFHWSDTKPWSSRPGNVADHRALKASCLFVKLVERVVKRHSSIVFLTPIYISLSWCHSNTKFIMHMRSACSMSIISLYRSYSTYTRSSVPSTFRVTSCRTKIPGDQVLKHRRILSFSVSTFQVFPPVKWHALSHNKTKGNSPNGKIWNSELATYEASNTTGNLKEGPRTGHRNS